MRSKASMVLHLKIFAFERQKSAINSEFFGGHLFCSTSMVCLNGIEPSHMASEATALSSELQAQIHAYNIIENCNIKCHQRFGERFSGSDASKGESQASFFLG